MDIRIAMQCSMNRSLEAAVRIFLYRTGLMGGKRA
jgi:hypothetical protein